MSKDAVERVTALKGKKMDTNTVTIVLAVLVAFIIGVLISVAFNRHQRSRRLQERFGPEYEHTLDSIGDKRQAEHELESRIDHVKNLNIRPLSTEEVDHFTNEWRVTQAEFVDEPLFALQKADRIIREVMKAKGYPVEDFEQRVADISVDYPELVTDYRGLHLIAVKEEDEKVSTEEMRKAMVHGRALFERLVSKDTREEEQDEKERI